MNWKDHIRIDKDVLNGKPYVKGTRISIDHIISLYAQGWTEQQVLENYPRLTPNDIRAVFAYILEMITPNPTD